MRFLVFLIPFLLVPGLMFAQSGPIVPCSGAINDPCDACQLVQLGSNILDFLIIFAVSISAVMFVVAGIMMVTAAGNEGQLSRAKGIFTNVIIGLILVLAAWLIIDTIMKIFFDGRFGPWNNILCGN